MWLMMMKIGSLLLLLFCFEELFEFEELLGVRVEVIDHDEGLFHFWDLRGTVGD